MSTMIAGCGFARMAWELAQTRANQGRCPHAPNRRFAAVWCGGPSWHYYEILDNAWDAWNAAEHSHPSYECVRTRL